jgi:hypothetical protein
MVGVLLPRYRLRTEKTEGLWIISDKKLFLRDMILAA